MGDQSQPLAPDAGPEPMTVSVLMARLQEFQKEIGCDGKRTAAHGYPSRILIRDEEWNTFVLKDIVPDTHMGCGCWTGIQFVIEPSPE